MPFLPPRSPMPTGRSTRSTGLLLSVGRRVFVNCPRERNGRVLLTDDTGRTGPQSVVDGAEVEILAWRPRGAGGIRYRVHSMRDGLEGWLAADDLRATAKPVPASGTGPAGNAARPESRDSGRKFGQRAGIER